MDVNSDIALINLACSAMELIIIKITIYLDHKKKMDELLAADDFSGLKILIEENKIKCEVSGTSNWTDVRQFNLMFATELGSVAEEANTLSLIHISEPTRQAEIS